MFSVTSATIRSRSNSRMPTWMARTSIIGMVFCFRCQTSKEHRQVLGKQNTLLEDDFASCDFPPRIGQAERVVPLADKGVGLVFDAVLVHQEAAGHVHFTGTPQIGPDCLDLNVADHVADPRERFFGIMHAGQYLLDAFGQRPLVFVEPADALACPGV